MGAWGPGHRWSHSSGFLWLQVGLRASIALGRCPARLLPGNNAVPPAGALWPDGGACRPVLSVGGGVLPGHLGVTALPSLAGPSRCRREVQCALVSGLGGGVGPVSGLGCPVPEWEPGGGWPPGPSWWSGSPGWLEVKPQRGEDSEPLPWGHTGQERDPLAPGTQAYPPQTPHLGAGVQAWGQGLLWVLPDAPHPTTVFPPVIVSGAAGPDTPLPDALPSRPPAREAQRGRVSSAPLPGMIPSRPGHCGAGPAPLSRVPPSDPYARLPAMPYLAFLRV